MPIGRAQMPKQVEGQLRGARKGKNDKRRQLRVRVTRKSGQKNYQI